MKVIAGIYKGRQLLGPQGHSLRPTPNKVKEALFSIIGTRISQARVADLYSGTGAIGIEALSRGADHVTFVDSNKQALALLRKNLALCKLSSQAAIHQLFVETFLQKSTLQASPFDLVFADPPYTLDANKELLPSLASSVTIHAQSLVILEHSSKATVSHSIKQLSLQRQYQYGDTTLSVFTNNIERWRDR